MQDFNRFDIDNDEKDLFKAILQLETIEECYKFFHDLCAPGELINIKERWKVCQLLAKGNLSYREINKITGVSLTTIGRVARFLKENQYQGYRLMLDKMNQEDSRH